jgi:hypothetical protein
VSVSKPMGKTGSAQIKKVGHTFSGLHGNDPNAKRRGYPTEPTPVTFGKGS